VGSVLYTHDRKSTNGRRSSKSLCSAGRTNSMWSTSSPTWIARRQRPRLRPRPLKWAPPRPCWITYTPSTPCGNLCRPSISSRFVFVFCILIATPTGKA
jgi:hypothetical protein